MATMKNITIDVTYAELTALIAVNGLFQGVNYLITDRGDRGLLFKAASTTQLEIQGTRYMLCPATYAIGADTHGNNWTGVWNSTKTAALNDLTIWNGQVWKCILAVTEPLDSPDLNAVNWALISKSTFTNFEYIEMIFNACYDVSNDWISKQWDDKRNVFGCSYFMEFDNNGWGFYIVDYCDWNYQTSGNHFTGNECIGIYNNSVASNIRYNILPGRIYNNSCARIEFNQNNGDIFNNGGDSDITNNRNNGKIEGNSIHGDINANLNNGPIYDTSSFENAQTDIYLNINNGSISGILTEMITDINVNKT